MLRSGSLGSLPSGIDPSPRVTCTQSVSLCPQGRLVVAVCLSCLHVPSPGLAQGRGRAVSSGQNLGCRGKWGSMGWGSQGSGSSRDSTPHN